VNRLSVYASIAGVSLAGLCVSALLLWSTYATHNTILFWPQAVGFLLCWFTRGIHNATKTDYWAIAMPANAAIFAVLISLGRMIFKRKSRA
jgi:hypothetical protein